MTRREESVAIIIPTFNSAATLAACLDSIRLQDVPVDELVVVDDIRTTDATRRIAQERNATVIVSPAGMAESRNVGVLNTSSRVIVSLDSDMCVEPGLLRAVLGEFRTTCCDGASIAERSVGAGYWSRARAIDKMGVEASGAGRSLRVFTRDLFFAIGGYDPKLEAGEDADFHRRALALHAKISHIGYLGVLHHEGDLRLTHIARKKYRYGSSLPAFEAKYGRLALLRGLGRRILYGTLLGLRTDPLAVPGFFILKTTDAVAGIVGRLIAKQRRAND